MVVVDKKDIVAVVKGKQSPKVDGKNAAGEMKREKAEQEHSPDDDNDASSSASSEESSSPSSPERPKSKEHLASGKEEEEKKKKKKKRSSSTTSSTKVEGLDSEVDDRSKEEKEEKEEKSAETEATPRKKAEESLKQEGNLTKMNDTAPATATNATKNKSADNKKKKKSKNELTHLIPGYTAPSLSLTSSSLDRYRPAGGLEAIRKQAVAAEYHHASSSSSGVTTKQQQKRKQATDQHAGDGWFRMRPTPLTDDVKKDLQLIRNRNYLDPKRFYKSSDPSNKFLQVGTVVEGSAEYYSSRLTKKERRTNLVDEVLADKDTSTYAQNKYKQMQRDKTAAAQKKRKRGANSRRGGGSKKRR